MCAEGATKTMSLTPTKHRKPEDEERILEELLHGVPATEVLSPAASFGGLYKDISFEKFSPRQNAGGDKVLYPYDKSLEALQTRGLQRHPRPVEVFGLLADSLEGKLTPEQRAIAQDMLDSDGEWLSAATEVEKTGWFRWKKQKLIVYVDPLIAWNDGYHWQTNTPQYAEKYEFNITGIPLETWVDLHHFPPAFIELMYGCSFSVLPQVMQKGNRRVQVWLRHDLRPVGRGVYGGYVVVTGCDVRASRGVSEVQRSP